MVAGEVSARTETSRRMLRVLVSVNPLTYAIEILALVLPERKRREVLALIEAEYSGSTEARQYAA